MNTTGTAGDLVLGFLTGLLGKQDRYGCANGLETLGEVHRIADEGVVTAEIPSDVAADDVALVDARSRGGGRSKAPMKAGME